MQGNKMNQRLSLLPCKSSGVRGLDKGKGKKELGRGGKARNGWGLNTAKERYFY